MFPPYREETRKLITRQRTGIPTSLHLLSTGYIRKYFQFVAWRKGPRSDKTAKWILFPLWMNFRSIDTPCDLKRPNMRYIESRTYNTKSPSYAWHSTLQDLSSNFTNAEDPKRRYLLLLNTTLPRDPVITPYKSVSHTD